MHDVVNVIWAWLVALALAASSTTGDPVRAGVPDQESSTQQDLVRFLDRTLPDHASGTLVAVRAGRIVLCRGFGWADRHAQVPAGCDTVYDIGSITKQFTAAAVLKLRCSAGLTFVTRSAASSARSRGQGRHHRAAAAHPHLGAASLGGTTTRSRRRRLVVRRWPRPLQSHARNEYRYSTSATACWRRSLQEAAGTGYERFAENLFAPAGMMQTGYVLPRWCRADVAVEYDAHGIPHGRPFDHRWATSGPWWNLRGNGGLLSTARDMVRWHRALQHEQVLDRHAKRGAVPPARTRAAWRGHLVRLRLGAPGHRRRTGGLAQRRQRHVLCRDHPGPRPERHDLLGDQPGTRRVCRLESGAAGSPDHRGGGRGGAFSARPLRPSVPSSCGCGSQRLPRISWVAG